ncbi:hypothetical protein HYU06_05685 [Candidatus Woesearchaeota archaeon]|nr:hypothetical protein [Candidatus Woesearchaeota archaeon]
MHIDFVFPQNNEEELIGIASNFGYSAVCFCYEPTKLNANSIQKKISSISLKHNLKVYSAALSDEKTISKAKGFDFIIFKANKDLRSNLEKFHRKIDFVYGAESVSSKDSMHNRNSGLNQILCKMLDECNIKLILSFKDIITLDNKKFAQFIGRVKQNIKLARKYKLGVKLGSFAQNIYGLRSRHDLIALLIVLGMHPKEAKNAFIHTHLKININSN